MAGEGEKPGHPGRQSVCCKVEQKIFLSVC